MDACHVDGEGVSSMRTTGSPQENLEPTEGNLSSSHAKKLAFVCTKSFVFGRNKKWKSYVNISNINYY